MATGAMLFPFSMSGSVSVASDAPPDVSAVIRAVVFALEDAEPHYVSSDTESIRFRAGPFRFVWSWNILVPISYGRVTFCVDSRRVLMRYHVSFVELLVVTLIYCGVLWLVGWPTAALVFLVAGIMAGYLSTWLRFPVLLRDAAEHALHLQQVR